MVPITWNASPRDEEGTPGPYEASPSRIAVIGLGNVLLGDDGFGPHVVEQ